MGKRNFLKRRLKKDRLLHVDGGRKGKEFKEKLSGFSRDDLSPFAITVQKVNDALKNAVNRYLGHSDLLLFSTDFQGDSRS